jgi:hypothetical protein
MKGSLQIVAPGEGGGQPRTCVPWVFDKSTDPLKKEKKQSRTCAQL